MKNQWWKKIIATLVIFVLIYCFGPTCFYLIKDILFPYPPSYDSWAIGNLRTVVGAQHAFKTDEEGFASTWEELRRPYSYHEPYSRDERKFDHYLDMDLSGVYQHYKYTLKPAGDSLTNKNGSTVYTDYICIAEPVEYKKGSNRSFYVDSSGIIRFEVGKAATKDS